MRRAAGGGWSMCSLENTAEPGAGLVGEDDVRFVAWVQRHVPTRELGTRLPVGGRRAQYGPEVDVTVEASSDGRVRAIQRDTERHPPLAAGRLDEAPVASLRRNVGNARTGGSKDKRFAVDCAVAEVVGRTPCT
eukprot:5826302-Prymnesium_polylepis.2